MFCNKYVIFIKVLCLISFTAKISSQTIYEDYKDGVIYLNLKSGVELRSDHNKWKVDYLNLEMFKDHEYYQISEVVKPFYYLDGEFESLKSLYRITFDCYDKVDELISQFMNDDNTDYAEKIPLIKFDGIPNDPSYTLQRDMLAIEAHNVWDYVTGDTSIIVGIVDTSFDTEHEDLKGMFIEPYNSTNNTTNVLPTSSNDVHGTYMTGIIGAHRDNDIGIAGLASGVRIMPIKFEDFIGAYEGIFRAAYKGANIINCSWGSTQISFTAKNIIQTIHDNYDCLILTSAGNDNRDVVNYPSTMPGVITIGGTRIDNWSDLSDEKYSTSNYGSHIDFWAPTGGTHSTIPNDEYFPSLGETSAACALASAMFALVWSVDPDSPPSRIVESIEQGAKSLNFVGSGFWGRINLLQSVMHMEENQLDLSDLSEAPFWIIPNPAQKYFRLNYIDGRIPSKMVVYNSGGSVFSIYEDFIDNWFDISAFQSGTYFIQCFYSNGESYIVKLNKI